jgi:AraC-like DNA-binding protein
VQSDYKLKMVDDASRRFLEKRDTPIGPREKGGAAVGLLRPLVAPAIRLTRYYPISDLGAVIDYYWIVRWDLDDDESREQETLPHPCIHLVVERGSSGVFGIVRGRFRKIIRGRGRAVAVRFRPGGFAAVWPGPIHELTGRVLTLSAAFGSAGADYERAILNAPDDDVALVLVAETFLRARAPRIDDALLLVTQAMDLIQADRKIARVRDLAGGLGLSVRALQRLFAERVGVSPKWVICRARLQEAAARVVAGESVDWSTLALDLGYYDQAHLIRAYRSVVGVPPTEHLRRIRQ